MTVLVLGGTHEGRAAAAGLRELGYDVLVSTATGYGGAMVQNISAVRSGRLNEHSLTELLKKSGARAVVDATHPFAQEVTRVTRAVCARLETPYLRFERPGSDLPREKLHSAGSLPDAVDMVRTGGGRVFLATGVQSIGRFVGGTTHERGGPEFFARILPTNESIAEAARWLPPSHIVAAIGPFDRDFNRWCWRRFRIDTVVTKDSGAGAGVEEKVETALAMGLKVVIIERPDPDCQGFYDLQALIAHLETVASVRETAR